MAERVCHWIYPTFRSRGPLRNAILDSSCCWGTSRHGVSYADCASRPNKNAFARWVVLGSPRFPFAVQVVPSIDICSFPPRRHSSSGHCCA